MKTTYLDGSGPTVAEGLLQLIAIAKHSGYTSRRSALAFFLCSMLGLREGVNLKLVDGFSCIDRSNETAFGISPAPPHSENDPEAGLCATFVAVERPVSTASQSIEIASRRPLSVAGFLRCWSDLDRTDALSAHLAALDGETART
ncbi:hypothetical protein PWR66_05260 [Paraburkholderia sp. A1RO-5]|uniref:hypothetical protein n=1 Tax=Paraburkholderia sp. A1RO-5 TaxID=3028369 RepID=UPI003B7FE6D5